LEHKRQFHANGSSKIFGGLMSRRVSSAAIGGVLPFFFSCGWISSAQAQNCWQSSYSQKVFTDEGIRDLALSSGSQPRFLDTNTWQIQGTTFSRVDCPPELLGLGLGFIPTGPVIGLSLAETFGRVKSTEFVALSNEPIHVFTDSGDPLGVGIVGGYNFKPWNNNIVVGPFASFDYLRQTINHDFAGNQFLGTTTHWFVNAGVKAGFMTTSSFYLYGLAGAAFVNHDLNVNFATAASSNVTTPGVTLGLGAEYQPPSWQLSGHPVSLFAQYQHTWWDNANFNRPASSPAFNYAFQREDDTVKFGVNFYFGAAAAPPPAPAYPVKAPASR
jgi:opacity protein-like surface antigen